jgi:hypothetical protein
MFGSVSPDLNKDGEIDSSEEEFASVMKDASREAILRAADGEPPRGGPVYKHAMTLRSKLAEKRAPELNIGTKRSVHLGDNMVQDEMYMGADRGWITYGVPRSTVSRVEIGKPGEGEESFWDEKLARQAAESIIDAENQLMRLERAGDRFSDDYLEYAGRIATALGDQLSRLGVKADNERFGDLVERTGEAEAFFREVKEAFNVYRKYITGAQAAYAELEELEKSFISRKESPITFRTKFKGIVESLRAGVEFDRKRIREGTYIRPESDFPPQQLGREDEREPGLQDDIQAEVDAFVNWVTE